MKFTVLTLFPNVITEYINTSIIKKAIEKKLVEIEVVDLRRFGVGKRRNVDDTVYGGGDGMIITAPVLDEAINFVKAKSSSDIQVIYLSPKGKLLNQELSKKLAKDDKDILLIAGHYEGVDERIFSLHNICEISVGDYVLTGGELPLLTIIDTVTRLIPGVIKEGSTLNESHNDYLLEEPQYTKPKEYKGMQVPDILLCGNHKEIDEYRFYQKIKETDLKRPDLLNKYITLNENEKHYINKILNKREGK